MNRLEKYVIARAEALFTLLSLLLLTPLAFLVGEGNTVASVAMLGVYFAVIALFGFFLADIRRKSRAAA
jgi:hypothetical protein